MKIVVINGSPKGQYSITLHTVKFIAQHFPAHEFIELDVGARIHSLEKDASQALETLKQADLLLFSYPVYTFIVPSQLHRFLEMVKAAGIDLKGKFATQISTSKHFYDVTAHRFISDNCEDLGLKYIRGLSADMDDLLTEKGQKEALSFFEYVEWCVKNDIYEAVLPRTALAPCRAASAPVAAKAEKTGDVVILTDVSKDDTLLQSMIDHFIAVSDRNCRIVNIREFPFKGGCLSCFHCAPKGECVYKDGFDRFLRENIQTAQAIVTAFTIRDHSMGAIFKTHDDREFCNGHRTVTMGMPVGYLVNGNLSAEENVRMILRARAEVGGNFLCGIAGNETDPDTEIDHLASRLSYAIEHQYTQPANFYGVGGMKIFRDLIWLMQGLMKADHRFYKAHGQYDFPQKKRGTMLKMYLVGALMANPKLMAKAGGKVNEGMIAPYKKALDPAKK